jgi:hypothetical protein
MRLEDIFLAKFAEITPDGLFTVVGGGLDRINAGGFPWSWGVLFLLARVRLTMAEAREQHRTVIERETPDGGIERLGPESPLTPLSSPAEAETGPDGGIGLSFSICLMNLLFPEPGVYKYRFKIDGQELGVANLLVTGPAHGEQAR